MTNLLEKHQNILEELSALKGIYAVYLFGSYAKNKIKPMSDLDICFFIETNNENLAIEILKKTALKCLVLLRYFKHLHIHLCI